MLVLSALSCLCGVHLHLDAFASEHFSLPEVLLRIDFSRMLSFREDMSIVLISLSSCDSVRYFGCSLLHCFAGGQGFATLKCKFSYKQNVGCIVPWQPPEMLSNKNVIRNLHAIQIRIWKVYVLHTGAYIDKSLAYHRTRHYLKTKIYFCLTHSPFKRVCLLQRSRSFCKFFSANQLSIAYNILFRKKIILFQSRFLLREQVQPIFEIFRINSITFKLSYNVKIRNRSKVRLRFRLLSAKKTNVGISFSFC